MTDNIKIGLQLDANIAETTAAVKTLNKALKETVELASKVHISQQASGGSSSSIRSATSTKAYQSATQGARSTQENVEYGVARGAVGTGASARDFAKQAQGLGGLVHLYATFAANLFAVGAAFQALKSAADVSNMVKGLDQLGAASGRGLGTLSKEVVKLTDGAVSLRDAMEATGKAVSSGMSNENLRRLAIGANNVSKALGVAVPDALSRLSRGISKLEPELLDELGIFVRVDKAAEDYARTLGKPTAALTDFERRTAFATATLDQLDKKFGVIKMDANPYDKLLASLKDVMQTGLEVVNNVLGPIVKLLAESPTALVGVLTVVAGKLLSMAAPTLNMMSKNRQAELEAAKEMYASKFKLAQEDAERLKSLAIGNAEAIAEAKLGRVENSEKLLGDIEAKGFKKRSEKYSAAFDFISQNVGRNNVSKLDDSIFKDIDKQIDSLKKKASKGSINPAVVTQWEDARKSLYEYMMAEKAYWAEVEKQEALQKDRKPGTFDTTSTNARASERAAVAALRGQISANASYEASIHGIRAAWKLASEETTKAVAAGQMGKVDKVLTMTSAGVGAVTTRVSGLINAFGVWGQVAAIGIGIFGLLDGWLSKSSKQMADFEAAIESTNSTFEHLGRTFEHASTLSPLEQISVDSIAAKATAVFELSESMDSLVKKTIAAQNAINMSGWDKAFDNIKDFFDAGVADKAAKSMAQSVAGTLSKLADDPKAKKAAQDISNLLGGVDVKNISKLDDALEKAFKDTPAAVEKIRDLMKQLGRETMTAAQAGVELKQALSEGAKKFADFSNSFIPQDKFSQLGTAIMSIADKTTLALEQGPVEALANMLELVKDPKQISLFPPEAQQAFISQKENIEGLAEKLSIARKRVEELRKAEEEYEKKIKPLNNMNTSDLGERAKQAKLTKEKDEVSSIRYSQEQEVANMEKVAEGFANYFKEKTSESFIFGANIVASRISAEWAKVGQATTNVILGVLGEGKEAAAIRNRMEQAQLGAQATALKMQADMIKSQFRVSEELAANTAALRIANLEDKQKLGTLSEEDSKSLESSRERYKSSTGNLSNIGKKLNLSESEELLKRKDITKELVSLNLNLESIYQQIAMVGDQSIASNLREKLANIKEEVDLKIKDLNIQKQLIQLQQSTLSAVKLPIELQNESNIVATETLNIGIAILENKIEQEKHLGSIKALEEAMKVASGANLKDMQDKLVKLNSIDKATLNIQATEKENKATVTAMLAIRQQQYDLAAQSLKLSKEQADHDSAMKKERLNTESARLSALKNTGLIDEVAAVNKEYQIKYELLMAEDEIQQQAINFAREDFKLKSSLIQNQLNLIKVEAQASKAKLDAEAASMRAKATAEKDTKQKAAYSSAADSLQKASNSYAGVVSSIDSAKAAAESQHEKMMANFDKQIERQKELTTQKQKTLEVEKETAIASARTAQIQTQLTALLGDQANKYMPIISAFINMNSAASIYKGTVSDLTSRQASLTAANNSAATTINTLAESNNKNRTALANMTTEEQNSAQGRMAAIVLQENILKNDQQISAKKQEIAKNDLELSKIPKKQAEAEEDRRNAEIAGTVKLLSASKKLFKEKTAAYKAITVIEKAYMAFKAVQSALEIANMVKSAAVAVQTNGIKMASDIAAATVSAGKAVINAISSLPFPLNLIAGAATAAVVFALLAKMGGKGDSSSVSGTASASPEAIRDLGSGQSIVNGQVVNDESKGVFGDTSAKSESIANSIEILENNSVRGLEYQDQMVRSLNKLVGAMTDAAEAMYLVPGLRKGESLDPSVTLGTISSWKQADPIINVINKFGDPITKFLNESLWSGPAGGVLQKISQAVFGGKTSTNTSVTNAGIQFVGTIGDVLNNLNTAIQRYSDIKVETKKSGGLFSSGSTSTSYFTQTANLSEGTAAERSINTAMSDVIKQGFSILTNMGYTIGDDVADRLKEVDITGRIELKDLETGTDISEYLQVRLSEILDAAASEVFTYISNGQEVLGRNFRKFGEGMLETVVRVTQNAAKFKQVLTNMGMTLDLVGDTQLDKTKQLLVLSDTLVEGNGGIEKFLEVTSGYIDKFVTEADQLKPVQRLVENTLIGLAETHSSYASRILSVKTRSQFADLVSSLDLTDESVHTLWQGLVDLSDEFDEVASAAENLVSKVGLAASNFASILKDGIIGKTSVSDVGTKIVESIEDGINQAITDSFVNNITTQINNAIITPLITALSTGTYTAELVSRASMQSMIDTASRSASALANIFRDPEYARVMRELSTTISESMKQVVGVVQISSGTISKLLKDYQSKVKSANDKLVSAYKSQISELTSLKDKFANFAKSLREFAQSLLTSNLSPLTPAEKYTQSKTLLEQTFAKAMSGDEDALSKLQNLSNDFLTISREYYASSAQYTTDFNRVQNILSQSASAADALVTDIDRQISLAEEQVLTLGGILDNTDRMASALEEAQKARDEANADVDRGISEALVAGFSTFDLDSSGILTREELRNSGIFTDEELVEAMDRIGRGDQQITAIEALARASDDTAFTLTSLNTLMTRFIDGQIEMSSILDYASILQSANATNATATSDLTDTGISTAISRALATNIDGMFNRILNRDAQDNEMDVVQEYFRTGIITNNTFVREMLQFFTSAAVPTADRTAANAYANTIISRDYSAAVGIAPTQERINQTLQGIISGQVNPDTMEQYFRSSLNLEEEYVNSLISNFTRLDTNFDGLVTRAEMQAKYTGITNTTLDRMVSTLDANDDGMVTVLEAINAASEGVGFTIDSLVPVNNAIANNTLTTANALVLIERLLGANGLNNASTNLTPESARTSVNTAAETSPIGRFANTTANTIMGRNLTTPEMSYVLTQYASGELNNNNLANALFDYISATPGYEADRASTAYQTYISNNVKSRFKLHNIGGSAGGGSRDTRPTIGLVGEQGPELLVTHGPSRIWSHESTKAMLGQSTSSETDEAMLEEIRKLNAKIDSLEATIARGDMMNVQATQQNTNEVARAVENSASTTTHANRVRNRVTLV